MTCDWADVVDEDDSNSRQVFISGLNENITEDKIREVFSQFGNISEIILSKNHKNSKRKDLGFVTFNSNFEAKIALEALKNNNYFDTPINVSLSFSQQLMQAKKRIK
ncbi:MAG: RNA recognition motif domain-containing protein, partial [Flammeovirgaceae bacterium]